MQTAELCQLLAAVDGSLPVQVYVDRPKREEGYFEIGTLALERGWGPAGSYPCVTLSLGREV